MIRKLLKSAKKTIKKLLYPVIYSYFEYVLHDFIARLGGYKKERKHINKSIGYFPNLKNPQSFNEKILHKKIYDRNPILPTVSDKYRVRDYVREVLGDKEADKILIPLLYVTDRPDTIAFDLLPEEYIIKPNHASGRIIMAENVDGRKRYKIKRGKDIINLDDSKKSQDYIIDVLKGWLISPYGFNHHEWAYQKIKRKIIIEKLLHDRSGRVPEDYKFTIFNGKCHIIAVIYDRFIDQVVARYTPEWTYVNVKEETRQAECKEKPEKLQDMINIAEALGKPFDYIRVDLYLVDNYIYFGELTSYAGSGTIIFNPASFDYNLGSKWKINPYYWK